MNSDCFKAYDIRGRLPDQLNEDIAWRIGRAYAQFLQPQQVVIGHDIRTSSQSLRDSLAKGLTEGGCDVLDIGLCGTEEIYHATFSQQFDGGIMVTASHNPIDYNGMKLVRENPSRSAATLAWNEFANWLNRETFQQQKKLVKSPRFHSKISMLTICSPTSTGPA